MPDPSPLSRITDMVVRHRMEESQHLLLAASHVLAEVSKVAGKVNAISGLADARANEAMTLSQRLEQDIKDHFRAKGLEITQSVDEEALEAVRAAKEAEASRWEESP